MAITITLPAATEERLRAQAAATGKDISMLITEAVEARLALAQLSLQHILAPVHGAFKRSHMSEGELDALLNTSLQEVRSDRQSGAPGSP